MHFLKNKINQSNILTNMAISGLVKPVSMVISYIYVPIVLRYLGVEKYGIWSTILSILSWISYFDVGIGNGLRNRLTESISKRDGQAQKLVSSAYAIVAIIMAVVAVAFSGAACFVNWNRVFGVVELQENMTGVVCTCVVFVCVNFILSVCKNVLYALQRAADVSLMELCVQIINMFGVLIAIQLVEGNLFVMTFIYGSSMLLVNMITSIMIYRKNREMVPSFHAVDLKTGKDLTSLGIQFFVIQICALVLYTTDSLIISYLYGAADVTPYNMVNKLFSAIVGVYAALNTPIWSAVTKAKAENRYDEVRRITRNMHLLMILFALGAVALAVIFRPLCSWWLGQELEYSTAMIVFGCLYCVLSNIGSTYASIANGLELMKVSIITAIAEAVVNIPISLFLAVTMNLKSAGILGGTVLSMTISNSIIPIVVHRLLKEKTRETADKDFE